MSATIHYRRASRRDPYLPTMAPSSFMATMERLGYCLPCAIKPSAIPQLRAICAYDPPNAEPYEALIEALEGADEEGLELYAQY